MKNIITILTLSFITLACTINLHAQTPKAWTQFVQAKKHGKTPDLPDYSYAGYKYSLEPIPHVDYKIFDVTKFGAVPNDNKSDRDAVIKAIAAAKTNGSGVVYFPAGRFNLNELKGRKESIIIDASNIVLRGAGSTKNGTEIFMRHYMLEKEPGKMWTVPPLFKFTAPYHYGKKINVPVRGTKLAKITTDSPRESFTITVDDTSKLKPGMVIALNVSGKAPQSELIGDLPLRPIWSRIVNNGISVNEEHLIKSIHGNTITLAEPIHMNVFAEHNWSITSNPMIENCGVEDIHFVGNFKEKFKHHKNFIHDSGWKILDMNRVRNGWIVRNKLTDISAGFHFSGCLSSSMLLNTVAGNRGHSCFGMNWGYGNVIGLSQDITNDGTWHGPASSHEQVGAVIWRWHANKGAGPDFHAQYPHTSLIDTVYCSISSNGGSYVNQPNHLKYATYWNFKDNALASGQYDFWNLPQTKQQRKNNYFGNVKVAYPNMIGYQGNRSFNPKTMGIVELQNKRPFPESLFEAQLTLRNRGKLPKWIKQYKKAWEKLKKQHAN
ncbi:DUF4955 domain-containing protein [Planctomycetota bacterium]|nr:DUF4955 domain-containing protein [Planctomycetota bacterium]